MTDCRLFLSLRYQVPKFLLYACNLSYQISKIYTVVAEWTPWHVPFMIQTPLLMSNSTGRNIFSKAQTKK